MCLKTIYQAEKLIDKRLSDLSDPFEVERSVPAVPSAPIQREVDIHVTPPWACPPRELYTALAQPPDEIEDDNEVTSNLLQVGTT